MERAPDLAALEGAIGLRRALASALGVERHDRVDGRVVPRDSIEQMIDQLHRRDGAAAHGGRRRGGAGEGQIGDRRSVGLGGRMAVRHDERIPTSSLRSARHFATTLRAVLRLLLRLSRALSLLSFLCAAAAAPPALAQSAAGALYGVVRDDRGAPLAKARVTVRGEQGEARAQDTNAVGEFRFLTLEPGLYHATVELTDYSTAEYPDLPVHVGRSTTVDVILTPSASGAVTVTAECPLLDERRIATGAYMTREELDKMPGARDPWALLEQAPGVLLDRVDVAGGDGVQPVVARAAGAGIDQNTYALDGVIITDPQSLDSTPFFYDFASLEEAQVTTGGTNVRVTTPGAAINLVTRRGTNAWRVAARYLVTDGDWQSDQDDLDLGAGQRFFTPSPRLSDVDEYGADAGGPILRDRLWMWGGFNRTAIDLDLEPPPFLFEQGAGDRASDNASIKIDVAPKQSNRLQAFVYANDSEIDRIGAGPTRSPEATLDLDAPTEIWKLEDSHVFGPTLYVQAHLSRVEGEVDLEPRGGAAVEPSVDAAGVFRDGFLATTSTRDREQGRLEISGFFGAEGESHEMTVGVGRRRAEVTTLSQWGARNSIFLDERLGERRRDQPLLPVRRAPDHARHQLDLRPGHAHHEEPDRRRRHALRQPGRRARVDAPPRAPGAAGPAAGDRPPGHRRRARVGQPRAPGRAHLRHRREARDAPARELVALRRSDGHLDVRRRDRGTASSLPSRSPRSASSTPTAIARPIRPRPSPRSWERWAAPSSIRRSTLH